MTQIPTPPPNPDRTPAVYPRWWLLTFGFLATAYCVAWRIQAPAVSVQERNLGLGKIFIATVAWGFVWLAGLSGFPWRIRVFAILGVIALGSMLAASLRIRGVSGDLVPIVEWRWASPSQLGSSLVSPSKDTGVTSEPIVPPEMAPASFPQFFGPNRNGILDAPELDSDWIKAPPRILWRQAVGAAWSGFAVHNGLAITQEQRGGDECVVAYELATGRERWAHRDATRYFTTLAGEGPRATPTIAEGKIFTQGATGLLTCLDLETGRKVWQINLITDNQAEVGSWGVSGSPLVYSNAVIANPGGKSGKSVVAYAIDDGRRLWQGGTDHASYSSPAFATLAGSPQILIFGSGRAASLGPFDGAVLWEHSWPSSHPHVALPVLVNSNRVLFSSGYGHGSELLEINPAPEGKLAAKRLWKSNRMKAKFTNLIAHEGFLYGIDDGTFACLDLTDGSLKWKDGRDGHGQILLVRGVILVMAENGEIVLLRPNPKERQELARFAVFNHKTWNPPALADSWLLVRNDQEAACLRLPVKLPAGVR